MSCTKPRLSRWLTTVDHLDIGRLYLVFGVFAGIWGGIDAMAVRTELLSPGRGIWTAETYNAFFTTHGLTMLFFFATPIAFGLANAILPPLVGADDMAFPRVNATAFWLLPPALVLARAGILGEALGLGTAPAGVGWTMYVPLSRRVAGHGLDLLLLGLHLSGVSTVMSAINMLVTVFVSREVPWASLDVFSWTMVTTAGLVIFAFPILGAALLMLLADRVVGTAFFLGGAMRWQHLFWFFGHPEVYILVLPAMGIISHLLPRFSGRRLFGYEFVVYSTLAIGTLSFGVWAHHMFATGIDPRLKASFMAVTLAIAVPSAAKTFNWIATLWNGRLELTVPMLFCISAIGTFVLGGVTGVFLASVPVDLKYTGTAFVVGHFHLVLAGTVAFALFAGTYYWFPILSGRHYDERLARAHFWLSTGGVIGTFTLLLILGTAGLPRRMATYPEVFAPLQQLATLGAYVIGFGQVLAIINLVRSTFVGDPIEDADPWNLRERGMATNEWAWFREQREEE